MAQYCNSDTEKNQEKYVAIKLNSQPSCAQAHSVVTYSSSVTQQPPKSHQPTPDPSVHGWVSIPQHMPPNFPYGLQCLSPLDRLMVRQKVPDSEWSKEAYRLLKAGHTLHMGILRSPGQILLVGLLSYTNKYKVLNNLGQKLFLAVSKTNNCKGRIKTKILDQQDHEIIHLSCPSNRHSCGTNKMKVYSPPGCLVGIVKNKSTTFTPIFKICDAAKREVFKIKGPVILSSIGGKDVKFKVFTVGEKFEVGCISKQWSGLLKEMFTTADNFCISFPLDLDARMKAVMLGACIYIDFIYYHPHFSTNT